MSDKIERNLAELCGYRFRDDTPKDHWCSVHGKNNGGWFQSPATINNSQDSWGCVKCMLDWHPITSIEHAMIVAESATKKLNASLFCLDFFPMGMGQNGQPKDNQWWSMIQIGDNRYRVEASTPSEAICRAAMTALGM
jgi:hypothetical protein